MVTASFLCQGAITEAALLPPASHLDGLEGVGISKLEVGSHRRYNKRQFLSFIF